MQNRSWQPRNAKRSVSKNVHVTAAVGMEETVGHQRTKRKSLFTRTVIWTSVLLCVALLLGTLAQMYSNSSLEQQVRNAQQSLAHIQAKHTQLQQSVAYYKDPSVIESEARQQLGYIRLSEQAVLITQKHVEMQQNESKMMSAPQPLGFWQGLWHSLFGG